MPQVAQHYPGAGFGWRRAATTHCVHGHAYTPENTLWRAEGWRSCRECNREAARRSMRRFRANNPPGGD